MHVIPTVPHSAVASTFGVRVALAAAVASTLTGHSDLNTYVLIAGGVIWAVATWRKDRRTLLVDEVRDQARRIDTLEDEVKRKDEALTAAQEAQRRLEHEIDLLKQRPDLDGVTAVMTRLATDLSDHRRDSDDTAAKMRGALDDVAVSLAELVTVTKGLSALVAAAGVRP